jgi:hypothetical protein
MTWGTGRRLGDGFRAASDGVPHPRPLPVRSSRRGENSIVLRQASRCVRRGAPPPAPPRSFLAERGEFDCAPAGSALRPTRCPSPGPSPLVPRGEGRIRSRSGRFRRAPEPVPFIPSPTLFVGEGRRGTSRVRAPGAERPPYFRTFVPSYLRTFVPSYLRTFVPSYLRTFVPSYLRTFVPFVPLSTPSGSPSPDSTSAGWCGSPGRRGRGPWRPPGTSRCRAPSRRPPPRSPSPARRCA